jgi:hypothetical protein
MVRLAETGIAALGAAAGAAGAPAAALGFITRNEWPHLGQRIFRPVGGTRRSSIWYGALHDSHSTFSIGRCERTMQSRRVAILACLAGEGFRWRSERWWRSCEGRIARISVE